MSGAWRGLLTVVLVVVLLASGGVVGATATNAGTDAAQAEDAIALEQRFALLPDDPGNVSIELAYAIPDRVVSLRTTIPDNATVTEAVGFERENATAYEWDGDGERPSITYRYAANETDHRTGPEAATGSFLAADAGDWALFTRPGTHTDFRHTGEEPAFERESVAEGEGAVGEWLVYLGPQETFTRSGSNQTFQLVVPDGASMDESPREVLSGLTRAADSLRIGDRDETVFVVAAPTGQVPWAVRGYQTGDADMWVTDDERLTDPENVWYHEYVHTRQSFETAPDARWLDEGFASYYATRLTFEHQPLTFSGFADQLARGAGVDYADVVLESPDTWRGFADYYKGGLAIAHLDRQLRLESDGNRTFEDVVAGLNDRDRVDASVLASELEAAGGERLGTEAERLVGSSTNASMWNRSDHRAAFGPLPARFSYDLPNRQNVPDYHVSGPYRDATVSTDSPLTLATGETLTVRARARNVGESEGTYEAALRLNETSVDTATGTLAPNRTAMVPLEHTFVLPGRYELTVDGVTVPVQVREPLRATVSNVTVEPNAVHQGETAALDVTVHNPGSRPAERELIVTRNFREITRETVHLGAEEERRVSFDVPFPSAGDVRVAVNGVASPDVEVDPAPVSSDTPTSDGTATPTSDETPSEQTDDTSPGFGAATAIAALALAALLARRRR